jgi:hypothetical protein
VGAKEWVNPPSSSVLTVAIDVHVSPRSSWIWTADPSGVDVTSPNTVISAPTCGNAE